MATYSECKTYSTYQEAKVAMPKANIIEYRNKGELLFSFAPSRKTCKLLSGVKFSNPADYCMTVEQFLKDGHKSVDGDLIIDDKGSVLTVGVNIFSESINKLGLPSRFFILSATASSC